MKLKNKLRRKLFPLQTKQNLGLGDEISYGSSVVGKVLIAKPYPFALIKLYDPELSSFVNEELDLRMEKLKSY